MSRKGQVSTRLNKPLPQPAACSMGERTSAELAGVALTSGACGANFEVVECELSVEACALRLQHPWILTAHNAE
jgi:hypothetical protein